METFLYFAMYAGIGLAFLALEGYRRENRKTRDRLIKKSFETLIELEKSRNGSGEK